MTINMRDRPCPHCGRNRIWLTTHGWFCPLCGVETQPADERPQWREGKVHPVSSETQFNTYP